MSGIYGADLGIWSLRSILILGWILISRGACQGATADKLPAKSPPHLEDGSVLRITLESSLCVIIAVAT